MGEETNLSCIRILNNLCSSLSKGKSITSYYLSAGCIVTASKLEYSRERQGRGKNFIVVKSDKNYLSQVIKVNINSHKLCK